MMIGLVLAGCESDERTPEPSPTVPSTNTPRPATAVRPSPSPVTPLPEATDGCATSLPSHRKEEGLPPFLGWVFPEPGTCYTISALEEYAGLAVPEGFIVHGVCFVIATEPLMEAGDFLSAEEFLARIYMIIDGEYIPDYHSVLKTNMSPQHGYDPETGEVIWEIGSGTPFTICFAAPIEAGEHTATVIYERTSGKEERFTWSFRLK